MQSSLYQTDSNRVVTEKIETEVSYYSRVYVTVLDKSQWLIMTFFFHDCGGHYCRNTPQQSQEQTAEAKSCEIHCGVSEPHRASLRLSNRVVTEKIETEVSYYSRVYVTVLDKSQWLIIEAKSCEIHCGVSEPHRASLRSVVVDGGDPDNRKVGKCSVCTETNACPACIACQQTGTIQNL
jgi:hypothetical protein